MLKPPAGTFQDQAAAGAASCGLCLKNKWTWAAIAVLLITLFALPFTRYKILGIAVKKPVTLIVLDHKTQLPVSNAQLVLGGQAGKTDGNGQVQLKAPVGSHNLVITKQYYKTTSVSYFVGFKSASVSKIRVVATGRLVPLTVTNKITGQPVKSAEIRVLGTTAKTNAQGQATVALPTTSDTASATVRLAGYNQSKVDLRVTDQTVKANNFTLTPSGKIYFLSNLNGSIDVVKSNLDGSARHVVLEGTGKEEANTTSLLASRDWRYLVLKARRDGGQPTLYLIDTSTDKVTEFDATPGTFTLIGWYGHNFIYDLTRSNVQNWQSGRQLVKSYDADNQQLNQLDQSQAEGDTNSSAYQGFFTYYIVSGALVYNTSWYSSYSGGVSHDLSGKTTTIRTIQLPGQSKKDYQPFPSGNTTYTQAALYEPNGIYYEAYSLFDGKRTYYVYEDNAVKPAGGVDQTDFNRQYPTFLVSPSGSKTFWTDLRDGKNTLFIGDANAKNAKQVASLNGYTPYGWYSDAYTLATKGDSELYIMPASGLSAGKQPLKVTDYYKPATTYRGYGYGYGGL